LINRRGSSFLCHRRRRVLEKEKGLTKARIKNQKGEKRPKGKKRGREIPSSLKKKRRITRPGGGRSRRYQERQARKRGLPFSAGARVQKREKEVGGLPVENQGREELPLEDPASKGILSVIHPRALQRREWYRDTRKNLEIKRGIRMLHAIKRNLPIRRVPLKGDQRGDLTIEGNREKSTRCNAGGHPYLGLLFGGVVLLGEGRGENRKKPMKESVEWSSAKSDSDGEEVIKGVQTSSKTEEFSRKRRGRRSSLRR